MLRSPLFVMSHKIARGFLFELSQSCLSSLTWLAETGRAHMAKLFLPGCLLDSDLHGHSRTSKTLRVAPTSMSFIPRLVAIVMAKGELLII